MAKKKHRKTRRRIFWILLVAAAAVVYYVEDHGGIEHALDHAAHTLRDLAGRSRDTIPGGTSTGEIDVFFAPCSPLETGGIDDRLIAFIEQAEQSILCAFYELELLEVADVLVRQHDNRVAVRIVTDSRYEDRDGIRRCIKAGIPVVFDERSAYMHNKFCVVDGTSVWTGSTNISHNGMFFNNNNSLLLESPELAENYSNEFGEMFNDKAFGVRSPENTEFPEITVGDILVECYFAPEDGVQKEIIEEIEEARDTIDFMAFSFTSRPIARAMADCMDKGAKVRGLFERLSAGSRYSRDDYLAENGAEVYLDTNSHTMHHKVIVVDGETVVTGSYNFSKSAETKNDENVLIIHSGRIGSAYTKEFEKLIRTIGERVE